MTMLTSLKALLFPTPAQLGVKADAMPVEGSADFAQLLSQVDPAATAAPQPTAPVSMAENNLDIPKYNIEYQDVNLNSWHPALAGATGATPSAPATAEQHLPVQLVVAEAASPLPVAPLPVSTEAQDEPVSATDVEAAPAILPTEQADEKLPEPLPTAAPPMPVKAHGIRAHSGAPNDPTTPSDEDSGDEMQPVAEADGPLAAQPADTVTAPATVAVIAPNIVQPEPRQSAQAQPEVADDSQPVAPARMTQPTMPMLTAPVAEAAAVEAPPAALPFAPVVLPAPELAQATDQAPALVDTGTPNAPVRPSAEAVSLLQLVRDHMTPHASRRPEAAAPARESTPDAAPISTPMAVNDSTASPVPLTQPATQPLATTAPALPTVDLSASLGAQVVDMSVSGQWIDGLARDIAGLSANGAQGRFQINATELGPIEVNIRQGDDGAAISLTVASEAAEQALRQDSDRLKLDASLSAVRISEVKIERTPHVAETARAESSANQNTAQQQSGGSNQNPGQATGQGMGQNMGQSSAQSHMQGRGQQRENIAFGHKAGNDGAVLNHMDAGETAGGAARARYA